MNQKCNCQFCGNPSTLLCHGRIWDSPRGSYRVPASFYNAKTRFCDANVCRTCAKKIGDVHLHMRGGCRWDTRDLCPECQKVTDAPIPVSTEAGKNPPHNLEVPEC